MSVLATGKHVVRVARDRNVMFLAASVAYYAFVSLIPLTVVLLVVGTLLGGEAFVRSLVMQVEGALSSSGQQVVQEALSSSRGRTGAGIAGLVTVGWSAFKLFRGLDIAFSEAYGTKRHASLPRQLLDAVVTLLLIVAAVAAMIAVGYVLRRPEVVRSLPRPAVVWRLALVVGLVVAFLPLYYVLPPVEMSVREALPGAVFAAVGWVGLQVLFQLYLAHAGQYRAYGFLGGILLFLTWLYFAGALLLLGAVVNSVRGGRTTIPG